MFFNITFNSWGKKLLHFRTSLHLGQNVSTCRTSTNVRSGTWTRLCIVEVAINWIKLCPMDNATDFPNTYPMDSDLSFG